MVCLLLATGSPHPHPVVVAHHGLTLYLTLHPTLNQTLEYHSNASLPRLKGPSSSQLHFYQNHGSNVCSGQADTQLSDRFPAWLPCGSKRLEMEAAFCSTAAAWPEMPMLPKAGARKQLPGPNTQLLQETRGGAHGARRVCIGRPTQLPNSGLPFSHSDLGSLLSLSRAVEGGENCLEGLRNIFRGGNSGARCQCLFRESLF